MIPLTILIRQKPRLVSLLAGLLLVDAVALAVVLLYQEPKIAALHGEFTSKRLAAAPGPDTAGDGRKLTTALEAFRASMPPRRDFAVVVQEIFDIVRRDGLSLTSVSYRPGKAAAPGDPLPYGISIDVSGRYPGIKKLLADISGMPRLVVIDALSLSSKGPAQDEVALHMDLTMYLGRGTR